MIQALQAFRGNKIARCALRRNLAENANRPSGRCAVRFLKMICLALLVGQTAHADDKPLVIEDPLAAALLESAATPEIDADEATRLVAAILEDLGTGAPKGIDPKEQALLTKLASAEAPFAVMIGGTEAKIGPLLPDARQLMDLAFNSPTDPLALWQQGDPSIILKMTRLSTVHPLFHNQLLQIIVADMKAAWNNSTVGNGYEPLRTDLRTLVSIYDASDPALRRTGRDLLLKAMLRLDSIASDSVPDWIYVYLAE
jgi:hypothetical protein